MQLHSLVRRSKSKLFVELDCIRSRLVRRELDQMTAPALSAINCPFNKPRSDTRTSEISSYPDRLDLRAPAPTVGQIGKKGQLQRANHPAFRLCHDKRVVGIGFDGVESGVVRLRQWITVLFPLRPEGVIREHCNDRRDVSSGSVPELF